MDARHCWDKDHRIRARLPLRLHCPLCILKRLRSHSRREEGENQSKLVPPRNSATSTPRASRVKVKDPAIESSVVEATVRDEVLTKIWTKTKTKTEMIPTPMTTSRSKKTICITTTWRRCRLDTDMDKAEVKATGTAMVRAPKLANNPVVCALTRAQTSQRCSDTCENTLVSAPSSAGSAPSDSPQR